MNSWRLILSWDTRSGDDPLLGMLCLYQSVRTLYAVIAAVKESKYERGVPKYWGWFGHTEAEALEFFESLKQNPALAIPASAGGELCVSGAAMLTPLRFVGTLPFAVDLVEA